MFQIMQVKKLYIEGLYEIISNEVKDKRGSFVNLFRLKNQDFIKIWGDRNLMQINISNNLFSGCIRGLHMQASPFTEAKIVSCLKGKVWDVAVDLRVGSDTYTKWCAVELSPEKLNSIFIPEGFAHGFQVLESDSQLMYMHSGTWIQQSEIGFRWDDPKLNIQWPLSLTEISDKDSSFKLL